MSLKKKKKKWKEKSARRGRWVHLPSLDRCIYHSDETRYRISQRQVLNVLRSGWSYWGTHPDQLVFMHRGWSQNRMRNVNRWFLRSNVDPFMTLWSQLRHGDTVCVSVHVCAGGDLILFFYSVNVCFNFILFICFLRFILHASPILPPVGGDRKPPCGECRPSVLGESSTLKCIDCSKSPLLFFYFIFFLQ